MSRGRGPGPRLGRSLELLKQLNELRAYACRYGVLAEQDIAQLSHELARIDRGEDTRQLELPFSDATIGGAR